MSSHRRHIEESYHRRGADDCIAEREHLLSPPHLFLSQQREQVVVRELLRNGITAQRLQQSRILEVGSGSGANLRRFREYGVPAGNLWGFDLLSSSLTRSRGLCPTIGVVQADGIAIPFQNETFDLILDFVVFTSVRETETRQAFAREMRRVLRPDGLILWYEFRINNPANPDVRAVAPRELRQLFPDCAYSVRLTTLAPPLARALYERMPAVCEFLSRFPFLLTHYVATIKPKRRNS